jgi:hypothetical protein
VHPKVVQELLGHSTISLTLDTYSHVAPAMQGGFSRQQRCIYAVSADTAIPMLFVALRVVALVIAVLAINASIPYLSWVLGFRFFGEDPGRNESDWRRRFLKRSIRGLMLMSHFARNALPQEENPFRKFDRHSNIFTAAVVSAVAALFLFVFIFNRLR